jgi:hypothetical protein
MGYMSDKDLQDKENKTISTNLYNRPKLDSTTYKKPYAFQLRDRVIMTETHSRYTGELGTVVGFDSIRNIKVQFDCSAIGQVVRFPPEYFELYFRKEIHDLEAARDYESELYDMKMRIEELEKELDKHKQALAFIQMKAHDTLRPIPFQDEDE